MYYLTIVSKDNELSIAHISKIEAFLDKIKIQIINKVEWLKKHKAVDIAINISLDKRQIDQLRSMVNKYEIDVFCSSAYNRKKKLILCDMDATIIESETLDEIANKVGIKNKIVPITRKAMAGELDFHQALKERTALLKGTKTEILQETLNEIIISKGARKLIRIMQNNDAFCVLVSGGFTFFTGALSQQLHFNRNHGNTIEIKNNRLTGNVIEPIIDKNSKLEILQKYQKELGIDQSETMAIGDGANDLAMLEHAALGLGYQPKKLLQERLINQIIHTDLESALYIQGYKHTDIT